MQNPPLPEVAESPALSLTARPGHGGIRTRKVAILVADGVEGASIAALQAALVAAGAVPRLVGIRVGRVVTASGEEIEADASMETRPRSCSMRWCFPTVKTRSGGLPATVTPSTS
jgi:catalase